MVIVGDDGPAVVVPRKVAALLARPLEQLIERSVRAGYRVDPNVIEVVEEMRRVAARTSPKAGMSGTFGTPRPSDAAIVDDELDTRTTAALLRCHERNVRGLASRGTLRGRRGPRGWRFDRAEVEEYAATRGLVETLWGEPDETHGTDADG